MMHILFIYAETKEITFISSKMFYIAHVDKIRYVLM